MLPPVGLLWVSCLVVVPVNITLALLLHPKTHSLPKTAPEFSFLDFHHLEELLRDSTDVLLPLPQESGSQHHRDPLPSAEIPGSAGNCSLFGSLSFSSTEALSKF